MTTTKFDQPMQPAVRLCSADCEEVHQGASVLWPLVGATTEAGVNTTPPLLPATPVAWCPFPTLQHHGYLEWTITGKWTQDNSAAAFGVRPISSTSTATALNRAPGPFTGSVAPSMVFSTGASTIGSGSHFILKVTMAVEASNNDGANVQTWSGNLKIIRDDGVAASAGTLLIDVNAASISYIDQWLDTDIGLHLYWTRAAGVANITATVKSFTCIHVAQRNGT